MVIFINLMNQHQAPHSWGFLFIKMMGRFGSD